MKRQDRLIRGLIAAADFREGTHRGVYFSMGLARPGPIGSEVEASCAMRVAPAIGPGGAYLWRWEAGLREWAGGGSHTGQWFTDGSVGKGMVKTRRAAMIAAVRACAWRK